MEAAAQDYRDPEWAIAIYDSGRIVATAGDENLELTLRPGLGWPSRWPASSA